MKKYLLLAAMAATLAAPGAAHAKRYNLVMTFGQDIRIAGKEGDVSIHAQCIQNEGGSGFDGLRIYAKSGQNAVMRGHTDSFLGNGFYLTAATPAENAELGFAFAATGVEGFGPVIDAGFVLNLTSMRGFAFSMESTILGLNSGGDDCVISLNLDAIKKFKVVE